MKYRFMNSRKIKIFWGEDKPHYRGVKLMALGMLIGFSLSIIAFLFYFLNIDIFFNVFRMISFVGWIIAGIGFVWNIMIVGERTVDGIGKKEEAEKLPPISTQGCDDTGIEKT